MNIALTDTLAEFASGLRYSDLDDKTVDKAKVFLMDYLSSAMAGQKVNKQFNDILFHTVAEMGEKTESTVLFYNKKLPALNAALMNGAIGHGADIDDGHRMAQGHPAVVTLPAILALAEAYHMSGRDVITAMVVGYDFFVRLGMTLNPYHVLHGAHTSGTAGAVAAGAAASNLLKLNPEETKSALGFSCMQAAGLMEVVESGQLSKGVNTGKAASNGVFAAQLAKSGAKSPDNVLEGKKGFLQAFANGYDPEEIVKDLGKVFRIHSCYIKLYPACRHMHCSIQIGKQLFEEKLITYQDIEKININLYQAGINLVGNIDVPVNEDGAKFSVKYALATAMYKGGYGLKDLNVVDSITPEIISLIHKMNIIRDDSLESREKGIRGTRIEFYLKSGEIKEYTVLVPKGDPEFFVTTEDIKSKLAFCADGLFDSKRQEEIFNIVENLENLSNIDGLFELLRNE